MVKGSTDIRVVLVVGKKNAGKTAYLRWIARRAQERGLSVAGFLSVGEMSGGKKHRYYLHNLQTGERHLLASREHSPSGTENVGDYFFEPTTFHRAEQAYREALAADLIIFDAEKVRDRASYPDPFQLAEGFDVVIVNGKVARENGQLVPEMFGRVLQPE